MRAMNGHFGQKGFTLIELLVVVAIMGMMGTASVGAYRAMRRGMEERAVTNNASQFVRTAYQRAMIERTPVCIYFWNELVAEETETDLLKVSGRAVAVRRLGRFSHVVGNYLVDEFGNLENYKKTDMGGNEMSNAASSDDPGIHLYRINGSETQFQRSIVAGFTVRYPLSTAQFEMISDYDPTDSLDGTAANARTLEPFAFLVRDPGGIAWQVGDAYGLEFAEIQLPNGYIWESNYPQNKSSPSLPVKVMNFNPLSPSGAGGNDTIAIRAVRPNASGEMAVDPGFNESTVAPTQRQSEQN